MFTNMMCALIQLINEGKISRAVAKALVFLLRKEGLPIPKELEDVISE
jgi:Asp-tRNA(Asn)/Glu-tRNA(Gln) amidotransferase B subunit